MGFFLRLLGLEKQRPTSAGKGVSKPRPASAKGTTSGSRTDGGKVRGLPKRRSAAPKTTQVSPKRKGIQTKKLAASKGSSSGSVSAARKRRTKKFRQKRDDK